VWKEGQQAQQRGDRQPSKSMFEMQVETSVPSSWDQSNGSWTDGIDALMQQG
jgi:hypothetical protein